MSASASDFGRPKVKFAITSLLALVVLFQSACGPPGVQPPPPNAIVGKWRSADGSYVVEFLPTGNCSAHYRLQGRDVGGPCLYTFDKDTITIRYQGLGAPASDGGPNSSATWHYSLNGDVLIVSVFGNSVTLQRVD